MSKHTHGPWVVGPVDDTVVTHLGADGVRYEVAQIDGDYNEPDLWPVMEANARLIAAAPDLLHAQTMGSSINTPDFLDFVADRLVNVYGESPNVDFVLSLRSRAQAGRNAIAKAENG